MLSKVNSIVQNVTFTCFLGVIIDIKYDGRIILLFCLNTLNEKLLKTHIYFKLY